MSDGGRKAASSGEGTVNVTPGTEKKEKEEIGRKKGEEEEEHRDANEYDGGDGSAKENVAPSMKDLFEYAKKNRWRFAMVMKSVNLENSPPRWDEEERKKEERSCVEELLSGMKVQSAELVVNHEQTHTVTVFYGENRESFEFELSLSGFVEEFLEKVKAYGSDRGRMSPLLPEQSKCFLKILIECQCFEDVECAIDGIDDSFGSANTMNRYLSLMEELVKEQLYNRDPIVKFDMVHEGQPHGPGLVVFGLFCGATFIAFLQKILRAHEDVSFANLVGADARKTLLVVGIMTAHSFGEGSGVGVSFSGVHGWAQGCLVTFAIGVHNVPEGLAVSTVLASKGVKPMQCLFWSVVSSLPQTVTAVPSFLFVETFTSLMPFGVGFSAGCMIWIVFAELLPDAFEGAEDARAVATAATMSAAALEGFRMAMQRLDNEDGTLRAPTLKDFGLGGDDVGSGGGGGKSTFYLALAPAFIASFALFTLRFTNKKGMLLVERLFRDKVRRNDEIDMNSNNNNIEGDVLKSSSARRKSSFEDGKIGATLGIASGVLIVMGVRAMLLTLRAIYYGGVVEIVFAVVGVMLARFILLRLPKLVFLDAFSSSESAEKNSTTTNSSSSLASLANGWDAIDGAFEAFIVSITCVSLSVLDGVRFASASESLENIHIEFPACIRALVRTAPAALSAFSCKAGNASELALRASLSVGFAFFFSAVVAAKFVKVFKSERDLNKHLEESSGKKNLFKIEGLLEAASCLMCAYAFSRALWPRATRETRRGSNDEQAGLMLGLMLGVSANVALFALGSMTPYTDAL